MLMTAVVMLLSMSISANAELNLPTKMLGNENYYFYKVKKGDSIYGIAATIGIDVEELVRYNPAARDGVAKDQLLFFPVKDFQQQAKPVPQSTDVIIKTAPKTITHVVKRGESVYGIAQTYDMNVDDLVAANPQINEGIKAGDVITIPQPGERKVEPGQKVEPTNTIYHTIKRGETLYSVSKLYNCSIEEIMRLNPGVTADHFQADDVIKVSPGTANGTLTVSKPVQQFVPYEVKEGDTFENVALKHGIDLAKLRAANPDVDKLKKGKTIYLPQQGSVTKVTDMSAATEQDLERTYANQLDSVYNKVHQVEFDDKIDIAMILPFQLQNPEPPRQALLYTDYYRGFAIAIDSIGNNCGKRVTLDVYDTEHNLDVTDSLLALSKMKNYDVLIAPSEPKQLQRINKFGMENNVPVLNVFSTKNDDYTNNPMTIQVNIPSSYLNGRVIDFIDSKYNDYTVVYLEDPDLEKKDIYKDLQAHFKNTNRPTKTLTIVHDLTFKSLSQYLDPGTNYLFLPSSGEKSLLSKVASAIAETKEKRFDCEMAMIGYPEYTIFANEFKPTLKRIDTYIFSRFYNPGNAQSKAVEAKYLKMFDDEPMKTTPDMMLTGFDTGMFVINSLSANHELTSKEAAYKGIQTSFNFERASNWGGAINKSVKFIHFDPDSDKVTVEE